MNEALCLDHAQLNVKGGHPPHVYLLMSATLLLRNPPCPRHTPKDKTLIRGVTVTTQHNVCVCGGGHMPFRVNAWNQHGVQTVFCCFITFLASATLKDSFSSTGNFSWIS